jgi:hypothetical protein
MGASGAGTAAVPTAVDCCCCRSSCEANAGPAGEAPPPSAALPPISRLSLRSSRLSTPAGTGGSRSAGAPRGRQAAGEVLLHRGACWLPPAHPPPPTGLPNPPPVSFIKPPTTKTATAPRPLLPPFPSTKGAAPLAARYLRRGRLLPLRQEAGPGPGGRSPAGGRRRVMDAGFGGCIRWSELP